MPVRMTHRNFHVMIKLDQRKTFTWSIMPRLWPEVFVTQMLTRDMFAVDNLLVQYIIQNFILKNAELHRCL